MAIALAAVLSARTAVDETVDSRIAAVGTFEKGCLSRFADYPPDAVRADAPFLVGLAEKAGLLSSPFKPNPKFWLKDVDLTCASPWNSGGGRVRAGTAISRRHIVFAKHFPLWHGVRIVFVGEDGTPSAYYIDKTKAMPKGDIMIASLDAELTPDIHPAKILPIDFTNAVGKVEGLPVVTLDQLERAYLGELMVPLTNSVYDLVSFHAPETAKRKQFYGKCHMGDSGSPTFLLVGKEPILLFCLTTSMGGYGVHLFRREIQAMMDELCPGYKLDVFDFEKVKNEK